MSFEFGEVINPGDENYEAVDSVLGESTERFDYNGCMAAYNELKIGAIPHFKFDKAKLSGFKKQFEKRGLTINVDFTANVNPIAEPSEENPHPEEHLFLKKLSAKKGNLIEPKRAGRKAKEGGDAKDEAKDDKKGADKGAGKKGSGGKK